MLLRVCTTQVAEVTASPSAFTARHVYVPESSAKHPIMSSATNPKLFVSVNREPVLTGASLWYHSTRSVLDLLQAQLVLRAGEDLLRTATHQLYGDLVHTDQVDGTAHVRARVLRDQIDNVERDIAEIVNRAEPVTDSDRHAVLVPFHLQVRIRHRFQLALEVRVPTLLGAIDVLRLGQEAWLHVHDLIHVLGLAVARDVLQVLHLFQPRRVLRLQDQILLRHDAHRAGGDRLAEGVARLARVHARIGRVHTEQIERDVVELVRRPEPMSDLDRHPVHEPLDAHRRITDRLQPALEMNVGALVRFDVVQRAGELRRRHHRNVLQHVAPHARRVLQILHLLDGHFALRFRDHVRARNDPHAGGRMRRTELVRRPHRVLARVLRGRVQNVQRHETEVVVRLEPGADRDRASVLVPLDAHRRIAERFQLALEVDVTAFPDGLRIRQRLGEDWLRLAQLLHLILRLDELLLHLLLRTFHHVVHAGRINGGTSCNGEEQHVKTPATGSAVWHPIQRLTFDHHRRLHLRLSGAVRRDQRVRSGVFRTNVQNVQCDVAKVVVGLDAIGTHQRAAIVVPLDAHRQIGLRFQPGLKVSPLSLHNPVRALQRTEEARLRLHHDLLLNLLLLRGARVPRRVLQVLDLLHAHVARLRVDNDVLARHHRQAGGNVRLAKGVIRPARVRTDVVHRDLLDRERHVPEVAERGDSRAGLHRVAILQPLDTQCRITDRFQAGFEMREATLADVQLIRDRTLELRPLRALGRLLVELHVLVLLVLLQFLDLLDLRCSEMPRSPVTGALLTTVIFDVLIASPMRFTARTVYVPASSARRCMMFSDTYPKLKMAVMRELAVIGRPSLYHSTRIVGSLTGVICASKCALRPSSSSPRSCSGRVKPGFWLTTSSMLSVLDLVQRRRVLRLLLDRWARLHAQHGTRFRHAGRARKAAQILTAVLHHNRQQIQRDKAELERRVCSGACAGIIAVEEPLNAHRRIRHRFDACLEVDLATLDLRHVTQRDDELRRRIDAVLLLRRCMGSGPLHMTQVDDFRLRNGSGTEDGLSRFCSGAGPFGVSTKSRARVAVVPATFWAVHWYQAASDAFARGMSTVVQPFSSLQICTSGPGTSGMPSFCQVMRGNGVPIARANNRTGSPSFTFTVVNRSTNFGATTCSRSHTTSLAWAATSPLLLRATHVTMP
uniref:Uncharacterized protein n=1 Tax=Anopheles farauti TaxID=69004 RepID=A0A182QG61_9DIPT